MFYHNYQLKPINIYLFSYGSLKTGFQNNYRLKKEKSLGLAKTKEKYNMFPAPSYNYPYLIENDKNFQINGELFEIITPNLISIIDEFEGAPYYYYRKEITVINSENEEINAYVYFKSNTNYDKMETDLPIDTWTKDFELAGKKLDEFFNQIRIAIDKMSKQ